MGQGGNPWTHPGRLIFATAADPKNLDPVLAAQQPTLELSMFIFSYAVRYDEHAQPVPDALREIPTIENGDVSRDGLTLKYKLRPNMKWQDGAPLTSKDLWFTWRVVMNPKNNVVTTDGYKDIASIDYSNPLVAVIHMRKLYAPFLQQLFGPNGNAPILPDHLLEKLNDDRGSFNNAAYQAHPIGSGPFEVVRWDRGSRVVLRAFDGFYLGKPKLREAEYRILPDQNTLLTQMRTHELDLAFNLPPAQVGEYRAIPGVITLTPPVYVYNHLDFNLRKPLFQDVRLRQALAYAIDRRGIIDKIAHGLGDLAPADESPLIGHAFDPHARTYPYDPARAKATLDALGWRVGRDGIRVRNGERLSFNLSTQTESVTGHAIQALIQRDWHDVGVEAMIKNYPTPLFFDNTANGILQGGHYDVATFAWSGAADPDDSAVYSAENFAPHGQNALFWNDPLATRAMDDALQTVDWQRRKRDYFIVQERLADEVPTIVLYFRREPLAYNSDLKGFKPSPVISVFWNTWEYSI
ncbi:MAG: peptide ABC transporter substrate-binding protein [Candidatus Eremiobacteraeota bacterium]|nr:peptide ABC transporter substrate-binding protein [Candidatus Eremiobacteraeota bacterium]MBV9648436.1 peptide ABC transporter substrate-binding protein [Candidatus Eremiobacteraeota bacterium]